MSGVFGNMDQRSASTTQVAQRPRSVTIEAPHRWDGVGQALRCAYGDHRQTPDAIAAALRQLDQYD